jgi:glycosyltransferase involved in cell wall biosynthesis
MSEVRTIVLVPVYNEEEHLHGLLSRLRLVYSGDVLFVDDGSVDCSPSVLKDLEGDRTRVIMQPENRGYGATLLRAFQETINEQYDVAITMDSDGQHRPDWIPEFFSKVQECDVVSGSRYRAETDENGIAPPDRKRINGIVTSILNECTGFALTDAFCGFKAYRVSALKKLKLSETGYAMPLQLWIQAKAFGLSVTELPVSRIYDDPNRRFGGQLDDPEVRLQYYLDTIERERRRWKV